MKKKDIKEVIDSENNLIGAIDTPETGNNKETEASGTTDKNAQIHGQNFKNDFLGRFGFYFYESENKKKNKIEEDLVSKNTNDLVKKSEKDVLRKEKLVNIADLLDKLSDTDVKDLIKILREKNE